MNKQRGLNDDMPDGVMEDVMLKRKAATEFFQRVRRTNLDLECYVECCVWEEVRERYDPHDLQAGVCFIEQFHFFPHSSHSSLPPPPPLPPCTC